MDKKIYYQLNPTEKEFWVGTHKTFWWVEKLAIQYVKPMIMETE